MDTTRTVPLTDIPAAEQMPEREQWCPPHDFDAAWGIAAGEEMHADTVPLMFCKACGEIREFRVPAEAPE